MNNSAFPVAIIVGSIILGGFYYAVQVNKQQSIEKQQQLELQQEEQQLSVKKKQEDRDYIAKRKIECYGIFEKEREQWNNVVDHSYSEKDDACFVMYESNEPPAPEEKCKKMLDGIDTSVMSDTMWQYYYDCKNNTFHKKI